MKSITQNILCLIYSKHTYIYDHYITFSVTFSVTFFVTFSVVHISSINMLLVVPYLHISQSHLPASHSILQFNPAPPPLAMLWLRCPLTSGFPLIYPNPAKPAPNIWASPKRTGDSLNVTALSILAHLPYPAKSQSRYITAPPQWSIH